MRSLEPIDLDRMLNMWAWLQTQEQSMQSSRLKKLIGVALLVLVLLVPATAALAVVLPSTRDSISEADAIAAVTGFYQLIFAVMAMLLGLVVALAYLTIRAVSREAAQQTMLNEMERYFNKDVDFNDRITNKIRDELYDMDLVTKLESLSSDLTSKFDSLSSRLALLEMRSVGAPANRSGNDDEQSDEPDPGILQDPTR